MAVPSVSMFGAVSHPVSLSPWGMATFRGSSQPGPITASHIAFRDVLGVADLAYGRVDALIKHPLPTPCPRERLQERAVWLGLRAWRKLTTVRCHDALAATAALEAHRNPHDERGAVEPYLAALDHAAILSLCCRSSPTRLASPSALIRTSSAFLQQVDPLHRSWTIRACSAKEGHRAEHRAHSHLNEVALPSRCGTSSCVADEELA